MNVRPIRSLKEDFQELGVLDEMDPAQRVQTQMARKQQQFALMQAKKQQQFAKMQAKKMASVGGSPMLNTDLDYDYDDDEDGDIDEAMKVRVHHMKGAAKAKARKAGRKYRRMHKGLLKRIRHSGIFKAMQKKLKKLGPATKGFRRKLPGRGLMARMGMGRKVARAEGIEFDFQSMVETVDALRYDTNVGQTGATFQEFALFAREVSSGFGDLSEDFVSSVVDYGVMSDACSGIAMEAMEYASAIEDHGDDISATDHQLLIGHLRSLAEELDGLCEVYEIDMAAIALTEGDVDIWDDEGIDEDELVYLDADDIDSLAEQGIDIIDEDDLDEEYGESSLQSKYGHGGNPPEKTFNVMHPLGISRVGQREKLILKNQLARESSEDMDWDY